MRSEQSLFVIGPEPPPVTGMEVATQTLLAELGRASVPYLRLDTADPNDELGNRGHWTLHNVTVTATHLLEALRKIPRKNVGAVYVPIAQEFPALYRDLAFLLIARFARKPTVVHLHGGSFNQFYEALPSLKRRFIGTVIGKAALGIVLTDRLRPALECVIPPNRVVAVPNGLDLPRSIERPRRETSPANVLFLSSLFPSKGLLVFIRALAHALKEGAEIRGTVAGSWPTQQVREMAESLTQELSLEAHIRFVGPVWGDSKAALLREADIFCFPSFYPPEGQPLVIIEAMAAGLPVVATAWRGIADTVVQGETGFLVDEPSPHLVAERLVYLAKNPEARRQMGDAGRSRYVRLFTQEAFGDRIVPLLRSVVATGSWDGTPSG